MVEKLRGVRDFYPEDYYGRKVIHETLVKTVKKYGFKEVVTPSIESLEMFTKKSGDAIVDEIYAFKDKGGRDICLIPELTPSVVRMIISRQKVLTKPVKWCSLSRHWRYERPQKGRQREFHQFNVDIFGVKSTRADFEILSCGIDCMLSLGLANFVFHVSNRKILESFFSAYGIDPKTAFSVVDKRAKVTEEDFKAMLFDIGVDDTCYENLIALLNIRGPLHESIPLVAKTIGGMEITIGEALDDLETIGILLDSYGLSEHCMLDLSIVRGLAYYTDMVFEVFDKNKSLRSIFGGGRYDNLIGLLGGQDMPAAGFAIGMPVLEILMKEEGIWPEPNFGPEYYLVTIGDVEKKAMEILRILRKNHTVEYSLGTTKPSKQLKHANNIGAKNVIILGERELADGIVTLKDLKTGDQRQLSVEELLQLVA